MLQRYSTSGPTPGAAHNLFVLGVLTAMFEAIGVEGLCTTLCPGERVLIKDGRRVSTNDEMLRGPTDRWLLRWKAGSPTRGACSSELSEPCGGQRLANRIYSLMNDDPSRSWSLGDLANVVGASKRSLQRRLAGEGTSFSQLVRTVRVAEASRLIESSAHSMTEIGYLCGFADSAQFSRDFHSSTGMSPSEFRSVVDGRELRS